MQEIIFETKPDIIIETGIAWGGSLVFSAAMLYLIGKTYGKVIGVDIDIKQHTIDILKEHPMNSYINTYISSSINKKMIQIIKNEIYNYYMFHGLYANLMVRLDSDHTHKHVLKELQLYSPLVSEGCYLIVDDTGIEDLPEGSTSDRPWGKGNNPATAVFEFLKTNKDFEMDRNIPAKLLLTGSPYGYLRRIKSEERNFPEDFPFENGNYECICCVCKNRFIGNKHRLTCKKCSK